MPIPGLLLLSELGIIRLLPPSPPKSARVHPCPLNIRGISITIEWSRD